MCDKSAGTHKPKANVKDTLAIQGVIGTDTAMAEESECRNAIYRTWQPMGKRVYRIV